MNRIIHHMKHSRTQEKPQEESRKIKRGGLCFWWEVHLYEYNYDGKISEKVVFKRGWSLDTVVSHKSGLSSGRSLTYIKIAVSSFRREGLQGKSPGEVLAPIAHCFYANNWSDQRHPLQSSTSPNWWSYTKQSLKCGPSQKRFFIRVVSHQGCLIRVVFHKAGLSWRWFFVRDYTLPTPAPCMYWI